LTGALRNNFLQKYFHVVGADMNTLYQ